MEQSPHKKNIELHVHPYFNRYGLEDVVAAMERKGIDVLALEYLDGAAYPEVCAPQQKKSLQEKGYHVDDDELAMRIEKDGTEWHILRAAEYNTSDGFHLLTIGADTGDIKPYQPIRAMIDLGLAKGALVVVDHPFVMKDDVRRDMTVQTTNDKEAGQRRLYFKKVCKEYSGKLALEWNGYCIPWLRKLLGGGDVNEGIIEFSSKLKECSNNPVVCGTDVHARNRDALSALGTAYITAPLRTGSGQEIVSSLRESIFSGTHENHKEYVSVPHFLAYFALPYVMSRICQRPRG